MTSYSYGIKHLLEHLQFKEQKDEIEKINSVCDYFIHNNLVNSIYIKLRGVFTNLTNDVINKIIDFFRKEIEKKEENEKEEVNKINNKDEDNIKNEQCLILCLIITQIKFIKNVKDFVNEISKVINESITKI